MQTPTAEHVPTVPLHLLPPTVDWRGSPADSPVKNQGACGSCWVRAVAILLLRCCMVEALLTSSRKLTDSATVSQYFSRPLHSATDL